MTNTKRLPLLPIPGPLMGSEIGSFAHHTVTVRLPDIARRAIQENSFSPGIVRRIERLIQEIPDSPIRYLEDNQAPDAVGWSRASEPYLGKSWLDSPWFFAETYFYRRMLEATGFFSQGEGYGLDPYHYQKIKGLESPIDDILRLAGQVNQFFNGVYDPQDVLERLLLVNLWANQVDLSLWPVGQADRPDHADPGNTLSYVLIDQRNPAASYIARLPGSGQLEAIHIDFLIDNAGYELVCDLCLADALLGLRFAGEVQFNLKIHPTFVSDAMIGDVLQTVEFLLKRPEAPISRLGERLSDYLASGRLILKDHPFWTSPYAMWDMPEDILRLLSQSSLVISKGDANYRRLLGDRHWHNTDAFDRITHYLPAPLVALRTLKSDPLVGLSVGQAQATNLRDAKWRTDGRWGIIQLKVK